MKIETKPLAHAAIAAMMFIVVITVWADLSAPVKDFLKSVTGHHWTTKGVFSLAFFVSTYLVFSMLYKKTEDVKKEGYYAFITAVLGGLALLVFYVWEFLY